MVRALVLLGGAAVGVLALLAVTGWLLFGRHLNDETASDTPEDGDSLGERLAAIPGRILAIPTQAVAITVYTAGKTVDYVTYAATKVLPLGHLLWRRLARLALWRYVGSAYSAEAVGLLCGPQDKIVIRPLVWQPADSEDGQPSGWKDKSTGRVYNPGTSGSSTFSLGPTKVVFLDVMNPAQPEPWEAHYTEALDLGQTIRLFTDAVVEHYHVDVDGDEPVARADGGTASGPAYREQITLANPGRWQDSVVDLHHGDDYAGWVLDPRKAKEIYTEKIDTAALQRAEHRGRLQALANENPNKLMLYGAALVFAATIIGFYAEEILAAFAGTGGGGGGGGGGAVLPGLVDLTLQTAAVVI